MLVKMLLFSQMAPHQNPLISLLPIVIMFVALYFLFIMPQQRADKKHKEMLKTLDKGARVLLSSGIIGVITNVKEDILIIEVAPKVEIKVLKGTVTKKLEGDQSIKDV
ncbi:MAG: preprotein translocase subunit YajC [bacterium (Candidatus Stahlbacteria) CG23_combo_of_CG06-09_8_20_14_all_34_7]|nr:MAG: preprotein translocase subunit YajC [bacterium (Candidatus Stahlbacteria) CG23_combo_of_CG06-09_8_20_14_all_34_7]